jgi:hypothetical protein|tara:strand:- start:37 stop:342 length:306 start_codon:yes stop_codon:yes gene_type:complete
MKIEKTCDCGCDVRGFDLYTLEGYKENLEKYTFTAAGSGKKVTSYTHHNGQEHILKVEIGYFDNKEEAIKEGKKLIQKYINSNVEEFSIWGDDKVFELINK